MTVVTDNGSAGNRTPEPDPGTKASFWQSLFLFVYHVVLGLFLAYAIYNVWPPQPWPEDPAKRAGTKAEEAATKTVVPPTDTAATDTAATDTSSTGAGSESEQAANELNAYGGKYPPSFELLGITFQPPLETRLILLVLLAGAIGSYVHSASSFVDYLGNRTFISSWGWWYLLRPFIGMMLALVFYFVFRGGFVTAGINQGGDAAASFINPFGIAALAGLVGMFSKVAADKLNEVFLTLFKPARGEGDAKRGDKLAPATIPAITAIDPNVAPAAGGTTVTITGTGFVEGMRVTLGGVAATAVAVVDATSLKAVTPAHEAGVVDVEVTSPAKKSATLKGGFTYQ